MSNKGSIGMHGSLADSLPLAWYGLDVARFTGLALRSHINVR